jgi:HKD family nuclease
MVLYLQDPEDATALTLLEAMINAASSANGGAGSFAWATASGLLLLIENKIFEAFLDKHSFDLLIGVDAVTNAKALSELSRLVTIKPNLRARAFYHEPGTLFHPKVCYFRHESGGVLITGSGNLTSAGLQTNWEAFNVIQLSLAEISAIEKQWLDWRNLHSAKLRSITDPDVLERASKNRGWEGPRGKKGPSYKKSSADSHASSPLQVVQALASPVLIAEIPRASNRWKQVNFKKRHYEEFFGAKVGGKKRTITLRHVDDSGALGHREVRASVEVASRNFRFELEAASGLQYPSGGPPIGVYLSMPDDQFLYSILLPMETGYNAISAFLDIIDERTSRSQMRAGRTDLESLADVWPDAPFWDVPGVLPTS